jgi:hypothetical protein
LPYVALDLSDREVIHLRCDRCARDYERVVIFAKQDGDAYALVSVVCHGHDDREAWMDVTFGSWVEPYDDHVTMSCRVSEAGAGAVDPLVASKGDAPYYGQRLERDEALAHPRASDMWAVVDAVVTTVPEAAAAVYG